MLKNVIVVYDDTVVVDKLVRNITGPKSFGSTIYKRKSLRLRTEEVIKTKLFIEEIIAFNMGDSIKKLNFSIKGYSNNYSVLHLFSNFGIKNEEQFKLILEKARFVNRNTVVFAGESPALVIFSGVDEYKQYIKEHNIQDDLKFDAFTDYDTITTDALVDLGELNNFMKFITGGFDARFFNALEGDEYTVTKSSVNKKKIKSEYEFYGLLPDRMKRWFAMPFDYKEDNERASYTMERYHMTDIAIRWIHNAIDIEEFDDILKRIFRFVSERSVKKVNESEYSAIEENLYITKVIERMDELKKSPYYVKFDRLIESGTEFNNIDEIVEKYMNLYKKATKGMKFAPELVIGHGDLCFSNILYNKETNMLRLIDPKGAVKEEELWTNPYYDIAKLSHSICGRYDFFNSGLFDIRIEADMKINLFIDFDNTEYVELFKDYLERCSFDYTLVRLYEASLFLSMLPLHIDNPQKVFGFLLNAVNILEELGR